MTLSLIRLVRRAVGLIGIALFAVLIVFSLVTRVAPLTGHELFIVVGGSMEPSIPLGSLVVTTPTDATTVAVGDAVTIRADNGVVITHRVNRVVDLPEGRFFELKGDANLTADSALVPARAVVGAARQYVPYAGYAQEFLSHLAGMVAALAVLAVLLLFYMLLGLLEPATHGIPAQAREPIGP
jgi:signal peptidase